MTAAVLQHEMGTYHGVIKEFSQDDKVRRWTPPTLSCRTSDALARSALCVTSYLLCSLLK
jgi:hypothetical protein